MFISPWQMLTDAGCVGSGMYIDMAGPARNNYIKYDGDACQSC